VAKPESVRPTPVISGATKPEAGAPQDAEWQKVSLEMFGAEKS
jgi:hypothetical protein